MINSLLCIACIFSVFAKKPDHVKAAIEIMGIFNASYAVNYQVEPLHETGLFDKEINAFFLDYQVKTSLSEEDAKTLLTNLTEAFIYFVNQSERVKPYLAVHPFTMKEVSISITTNPELIVQDNLTGAEISDGVISYYYKRPENPRPVLVRKEALL